MSVELESFCWGLMGFPVKQVFSEMDFIGWYTTGGPPNNCDIKVHKQICDINESPIMLKLNPCDKNIDVNISEAYFNSVGFIITFPALAC